MAAILTTITFSAGDQITSAKLNEITTGTTISSDAVTGSTLVVTGGKLKVGTITSAQMGVASVTTASISDGAVKTIKIADSNVTTEKIADLNVTIGKIAAAAFPAQAEMEAETASLLVTPDVLKYSPIAAKAFGVYPTVTSDRTMTASRGATVARIDGNNDTVTLDPAMDSANYVVQASLQSPSSTKDANSTQIIAYDLTASTFKIFHPGEDSHRGVSFVVYGTLA